MSIENLDRQRIWTNVIKTRLIVIQSTKALFDYESDLRKARTAETPLTAKCQSTDVAVTRVLISLVKSSRRKCHSICRGIIVRFSFLAMPSIDGMCYIWGRLH